MFFLNSSCVCSITGRLFLEQILYGYIPELDYSTITMAEIREKHAAATAAVADDDIQSVFMR
jgi:hypothetical protein